MVLIENEEYKELVIKANKYDELKRNRAKAQERVCREQENKCGNHKENNQNKDEEIEISVHKCTKKEMVDVLNNLKNKILGEDK